MDLKYGIGGALCEVKSSLCGCSVMNIEIAPTGTPVHHEPRFVAQPLDQVRVYERLDWTMDGVLLPGKGLLAALGLHHSLPEMR